MAFNHSSDNDFQDFINLYKKIILSGRIFYKECKG